MIQKIKDISRVTEEVDMLKKRLRSTSDAVTTLKEDVAGLREEITGLSSLLKEQNEAISSLNYGAEKHKEICDGLLQERYEFKKLRGHLQKTILDEFDVQLRSGMKNFEDVRSQEFKQLRTEVSALISRLGQTSSELEKFNKIASNIKAKDFALEKYAKTLEQRDNEKLNLMKRIDTLERMVSKMRRTQKFK
ncbi:MAG: hypothetical protein ACLFP2_01055 [Candidatus Woesearchaeota archaeon]